MLNDYMIYNIITGAVGAVVQWLSEVSSVALIVC